MTEKRFTFDMRDETPCLIDEETQCLYPIKDTRVNVKILINRLNDLDTFRKGYFELEKEVKQLRDENHRLRLTKLHLEDVSNDIEWLKEHWSDVE